MKTFICQICGDAYLGEEKPKNCPFCGARENFIKEGREAKPIFLQDFSLSEASREKLEMTLKLEMHAYSLYLCMSENAGSYEVRAMFKRLAKVEMEHAVICVKFLKINMPEIKPESCSKEDIENFKQTLHLEEDASDLYLKFSTEAEEQIIKILFNALWQAESDHVNLMKEYLK